MWEMKFRGMGDRKRLATQQPIQQQCYACDEMASKFFVNDLENPYTTAPDKPFSWIRGRQVGGRSIMWGRQVYRWSDLDFEANAREGIGVDWPIRYADIAPWYDYVETFVGISGQAEHALEFRARIIFLNASTIESARILLNSEGNLANSSGQVGKNLMDHIMGGGASGRVDAPADRDTIGNRPNGIYVPRFRNVGKNTSSTFVRGYGFQGGGGRSDWGRGADQTGFGAEFKKSLRRPGPWGFSFYGFGEMLPRPENFVEIDKTKSDAWGIPVVKIHCAYGVNEKALVHDMSITGAEMLAEAGAHDI